MCDFKIKEKHIAIIVCIILVVIIISQTIGTVPVNHTGILKKFGRVQDTVVPEGIYFKVPFFDSIESISNMVTTCKITASNKDKNATTNETAETKDQQLITSYQFDIQYQLDREKSFLVYKNYGINYENQLIVSNALPAIKLAFTKYSSEEIVLHKEDIASFVKETLEEYTDNYGIHILKVNFASYDFTDEYNAILEERAMLKANITNEQLRQEKERVTAQTAYDVAVKEAEKTAETNRITSENEKAVAIIKAEQDKETALINANATAEANKIKVDNEAYVTTTKAEADKTARLAAAEATKAELEAQSSGLTELIIQKTFIEKWNGQLIPSFNGDGGFNFANMTDIYKTYLFGNEE